MHLDSAQLPPRRSPVGFGIVVLLHVVLGWALMNGLARKVVEVIKAPIETKIIDEVKPPPPPPPENLPPPPKMAAPPPSFVPPPEVQVATPQQAPAITVTREAPPPAPVTVAPAPAPAVVAAPPAPPAPPARPRVPVARVDVGKCVNYDDYPAAALRAEASGTTRLRLTVDPSGVVSKADVINSAGPTREHRLLDRAAVSQMASGTCKGVAATDEAGKPIGSTIDVDVVWRIQ
ncbi:TonB family protein [Ideonella sp. DXS22W]|uniref:TonB family protein n=1 Tax=Pseudaquabacterium inlustre TaxID=2984192 RepID=A0ABU9CL81_9BURK